MELKDVEDSVGTFDLQMVSTSEGGPCELPLFGVYCLRLAAQPECLVMPTVTGYLNLQVLAVSYCCNLCFYAHVADS